MAKLTIGFGVVLILLGAWGFISTGNTHPTALIPAYFGLVLAWSGILANTENAKRPGGAGEGDRAEERVSDWRGGERGHGCCGCISR